MEEEVELLHRAKLLQQPEEMVSVEKEQPLRCSGSLVATQPECEIKAGDNLPQGQKPHHPPGPRLAVSPSNCTVIWQPELFASIWNGN